MVERQQIWPLNKKRRRWWLWLVQSFWILTPSLTNKNQTTWSGGVKGTPPTVAWSSSLFLHSQVHSHLVLLFTLQHTFLSTLLLPFLSNSVVTE
ncbi:MAG: hypothetical protein J3R72DRAFT_429851 [Linnemannia gamsii]|nr:MAG: hypothetical protein J3R72DRAFT_429851 [Linnemannia gamsii]